MAQSQLIQVSRISNIFQKCTQLQYSGQINIQDPKKKEWNFYYQLGQLVWATESSNTCGRLRRNITEKCPQIDVSSINFFSVNISVDYWDFLIVDNLYKAQKITRKQINDIVESTIFEVMCNLTQEVNSPSFVCKQDGNVKIGTPAISISLNILVKKIQDFQNNWLRAGLANFHPNLSPVLRNPDLLRSQVNPIVYKNLETLINGQYTLWDLAAKMKQSVVAVTHSLRPFIQQGTIELIELVDLPLPVPKVNSQPIKSPVITKDSPLIACVDDSPQICKLLENIITANGMRFIAIQDPIEALPILIKNKPSLIFLDLMMPVINGYEICNQLRSTSLFAKTPLVILTGNDGIVDRVRSKMVGATEFIPKPIKTDKVLEMMNKYL